MVIPGLALNRDASSWAGQIRARTQQPTLDTPLSERAKTNLPPPPWEWLTVSTPFFKESKSSFFFLRWDVTNPLRICRKKAMDLRMKSGSTDSSWQPPPPLSFSPSYLSHRTLPILYILFFHISPHSSRPFLTERDILPQHSRFCKNKIADFDNYFMKNVMTRAQHLS